MDEAPKKIEAGARQKPKPNWQILIFAIPFSCFSVYMSYGFYLSYEEQKGAAYSFAPVSAKIISSGVEATMHSQPGASSSRSVYLPRITYEYEINGRKYQSARFSYFGAAYDTSEQAQRVSDRYPVGAVKSAYYNPDEPTEAVLNKSAPGPWWEYFWFPAIFITVSVLSFLAAWKGWLKYD